MNIFYINIMAEIFQKHSSFFYPMEIASKTPIGFNRT